MAFWAPVFFIGVGLIFLVISGSLTVSRLRFVASAVTTEGRKTSSWEGLHFTTADGRAVSTHIRHACLRRCENGPVQVRYDPRRPLSAEIIGDTGNWLVIMVTFLFGAVAGGLGLGALLAFNPGLVQRARRIVWTSHDARIRRVRHGVDADGPFWAIQVAWTDPGTGRIQLFESPYLRQDPAPWMTGRKTLRLRFTGGDPSEDHRVELDFLPAEMRPRPPPEIPVRIARPAARGPSLDGAMLLLYRGLLGAGVICFGLAAFYVFNRLDYRGIAERAEARVVEVLRSEYDLRDTIPVFAFDLPDGRRIVTRAANVVQPPGYLVGDPLDIVYDPENPEDAEILGELGPWGPIIFLSIFGGLFLAGAAAARRFDLA